MAWVFGSLSVVALPGDHLEFSWIVNWFAVRSSREPIGLQDEQTQTLAAHYTFQFFAAKRNKTSSPQALPRHCETHSRLTHEAGIAAVRTLGVSVPSRMRRRPINPCGVTPSIRISFLSQPAGRRILACKRFRYIR